MPHYHVGYNDVGYLPDPDVIVCVESANDARDALVAKVDELAEYLEMACGHANFVATCSLCGHWRRGTRQGARARYGRRQRRI